TSNAIAKTQIDEARATLETNAQALAHARAQLHRPARYRIRPDAAARVRARAPARWFPAWRVLRRSASWRSHSRSRVFPAAATALRPGRVAPRRGARRTGFPRGAG